MSVSQLISDNLLRERLQNLTLEDRDFWSFKGNSRREHGHALFQYPAMGVPQLVGALLDEVCEVYDDIECVGDPFAGSGTNLTESMLRGLSFAGLDINPLAILLCRVKAGPFFIDALREKTRTLFERIQADNSIRSDMRFNNQDKWYRDDVQIALTKLRRAILRERSLWARRFFWVALAEVTRLTSNSRSSTFKLHIRPAEEVENLNLDPLGLFRKAIKRNIEHMKQQSDYLGNKGFLNRGRYQRQVDISLADARSAKSSISYDVLLSSPPYGDNKTTVTYGQYSYLPLQWIELEDIDPQATAGFLDSTHEIDSRSLGGSTKIEKRDIEELEARSPAYRSYITHLKQFPADRVNRVTAYLRDLHTCLEPALSRLRAGGLMIWVVGNRKVGGLRLPLDAILSEMLTDYGAVPICTLTRRIVSKRMAPKNSIAETIANEAVLVMRKTV